MMLSKDILNNKRLEGYDSLLAVSVEYMIAKIAQQVINNNVSKEDDDFSAVEKFNKTNKISFTKILTYPFFIALANGHSYSLYSLFGDFYSVSDIPVSFSIFKLLKSGGNKPSNTQFMFFNIDNKVNPLGVEIRSNYTSVDDLLNKIKDARLTFNGKKIQFKEILILSDKEEYKELYSAIDNGVKAVQSQSYNSFFEADIDIIKLHSSYFRVIKSRHDSEEAQIINYEDLESNSKRPFYREIV